MKDVLFFILGAILAAPAVFMILSGQLAVELLAIAYMAFICCAVPKKVWRKIIRANLRATKLLEGK